MTILIYDYQAIGSISDVFYFPQGYYFMYIQWLESTAEHVSWQSLSETKVGIIVTSNKL